MSGLKFVIKSYYKSNKTHVYRYRYDDYHENSSVLDNTHYTCKISKPKNSPRGLLNRSGEGSMSAIFFSLKEDKISGK